MTTRGSFDYSRVPGQEAELRALAVAVGEGTKQQTQAGVATGHALLLAKAMLDHGTFLDWCNRETPYSPAMAQNYMRLAKLFHNLDGESRDTLCLLPLTGAFQLAQPWVGDNVVAEILERVRQGERLTVEMIKAFVGTKGETGEPAPDPSPQMVNLIVNALDTQRKRQLSKFLGKKPGRQDKAFMKALRSGLVRHDHGNDGRGILLIAHQQVGV